MNLKTKYLGFELPHPFMAGASPLVDNLDTVKKLEDGGVSAITLHSLFEEQVVKEQEGMLKQIEEPGESFAEALSYFPNSEEFNLGPDEYLNQVRRIKETVSIPVIASLNASKPGAWIDYAKLIEQAGADALELNIYFLATDIETSGQEIEQRVIDIVTQVRGAVRFPLAVKMAPFYSSFGHIAKQLELAGADGLVIFNRFYQPDFNIEELEVEPKLKLSESSELLLRLRWLSILHNKLKISLACTGGVHTVQDAIKAIMAGADAIQIVSSLLKWGPAYTSELVDGLNEWLGEREYESLEQMKGSLSLENCPDPWSHERTNYIRILQSWCA